MPACEKCWRDAHSHWHGNSPFPVSERYRELIMERESHPCTPEEQAGEEAGLCRACGRKTLHQWVRDWCMNPHCASHASDASDQPLSRRKP